MALKLKVTLVRSGIVTNTGTIRIDAGSAMTNFGGYVLTQTAGNLCVNGTFTDSTNGDLTVGGAGIAVANTNLNLGTGNLNKDGAGTLFFRDDTNGATDNTYTGDTRVAQGTVELFSTHVAVPGFRAGPAHSRR